MSILGYVTSDKTETINHKEILRISIFGHNAPARHRRLDKHTHTHTTVKRKEKNAQATGSSQSSVEVDDYFPQGPPQL